MASSRVPWILTDMMSRVDDRLVSGWYRALSVRSGREHRRMRAARRPFIDPKRPEKPSLIELDSTAHWIIEQSRFGAAALGGVAGLGGAASVPPEIVASIVAVLRLGQRLGLVYGFDPDTDRGQMALWRALAAGYDVELPEKGPVGIRVTDLPAIVAPRTLSPRTVSGDLAAQIVQKSAWMIAGRVTRLLPVMNSGASAVRGRKTMGEIGERMRQVFRQMAEVPFSERGVLEDALEITGG
jgi:hypothetical protein